MYELFNLNDEHVWMLDKYLQRKDVSIEKYAWLHFIHSGNYEKAYISLINVASSETDHKQSRIYYSLAKLVAITCAQTERVVSSNHI